MLFLRLTCIICLFTADTRASNHWIVTEAGLIQSKDESLFVMDRSFDLLTFINQETRWQNILYMYDDLVERQMLINSLWTDLLEQSDITMQMNENELCKAAGDMENIDWYISFVEEGKYIGITEQQFLLYAIEEFENNEVPDCKKISSLTFSMSTFEHLESMINREHLNATPETILPEIFSPVYTVDQYGHWLAEVLRKNTTSWLHYNLASIYWRLKGNVPKALECSRRAVHHAPRYYKTISLLGMGSILHRSEVTDDAIVVLEAAVDHSPTFPLSHFTLGVAYAVLGDFNSSLQHLKTSMILLPNFDLAKKYHNAVLCHIDMFPKMQYSQRTLNKLDTELKEFKELEIQWYKMHTVILKTMKHEKKYDYTSIKQNLDKIEEITNIKLKDLYMDRKRNTMVHNLIGIPLFQEWKTIKGVFALVVAYDLELKLKSASKNVGLPSSNLVSYNTQVIRNKTKILKEFGPRTPFSETLKFPFTNSHNKADKVLFNLPELSLEDLEPGVLKKANGKMLYPPNMKVNRNTLIFDKDPDWPTDSFCVMVESDFPNNSEEVYPVFLPFENKGISLKKGLLTEMIGVSAFMEHELPWHPPNCPHENKLSSYTTKKGMKIHMVKSETAIEFLRGKLLTYVSHDSYDAIKSMQDTEIGHRIHMAMEKKLASKWVLYTLAALHWRVRGKLNSALNCLLAANRVVDNRYRDVVLVSLGSVFLEMGLWEDSLFFAESAYKINSYEPPTNFLLAQVHMVKKFQRAQFFHLRQVLRVDPNFMTGFALKLMYAWACIEKRDSTNSLGQYSPKVVTHSCGPDVMIEIKDNDVLNDEVCREAAPGISMVCERSSSNCHLSYRQCNPEIRDPTALTRMMELREEENTSTPQEHNPLESSFDKFIKSKPESRSSGKAAHLKSYTLMIKTFKDLVASCGRQGCGVDLERLKLKKEECAYYGYDLHYWIQHVCFNLELSEFDIAADVTAMAPSHKDVPECQIPLGTSEDFFVSRILAVDTEHWAPSLSLMEHVGGLFSQPDYGLLGAKLSKYIETNPTSWEAAVAAGWYCGASGRGACAARCLAAAHALAPAGSAHLTLRPLIGLLHLQSRAKDSLDIAYLAFYDAPKNKVESFLVGLLHYFRGDLNEALWMYRYSVSFDKKYIPPAASFHFTMCRIAFNENGKRLHQTTT